MKIYINKYSHERRTELNLKMLDLPVDNIATLNGLGWFEYKGVYPQYNKVTQTLQAVGELAFRDGVCYQEFEAVDLPASLVAELTEKGFQDLREERNKRLAATDYLVLDYPLTTEQLQQVRIYRQTLRDLPNQEDAPYLEGIPWPELPAFLSSNS